MPLLIAAGVGMVAGVALGRLSCLVVSPDATPVARVAGLATGGLALYGAWTLAGRAL